MAEPWIESEIKQLEIRQAVERARQAQQAHQQRYDVQLELFNLPLDFDPEDDKLADNSVPTEKERNAR